MKKSLKFLSLGFIGAIIGCLGYFGAFKNAKFEGPSIINPEIAADPSFHLMLLIIAFVTIVISAIEYKRGR